METSIYYYIFLFLIYFFLKNLLQKLSKRLPPSPLLSFPIIGHLYLIKKPLHRTLAKLSEKHGPIFFLKFGSRPVVIVSSPSLAEECFTKSDFIFANRPALLAGKHLGYNYTTLVWASYGSHWHNLRRTASLELLSSHRLQLFHGMRADEVKSLLLGLFQGSIDGEFRIVDMKSTFDEVVLVQWVIAGKRYYGEDETDVEEAKKFKQMVVETFELSGATNVGDFVPVLNYVGENSVEKKLIRLQKKRDKFMQDLIEEHRKSQSGSVCKKRSKNTMVDVLLARQETEPEYYTDEIIRGFMQVMLLAGTDTSAGTMEWMLSIWTYRIDVQVGQTRLIEEADLPNLRYLNAIISETLRLYPADPLLVPHESSQECTLGGYHVPNGAMLLVNVWTMHRDPKLWEQPEQFKPERLLTSKNQQTKFGFKFLPFGAGRRGCPGEGLATRMIGLALGTLIQCFEWERNNGDEMVDMSEGGGLTMPKGEALLAKCRPRSKRVGLLSQL